MQDQNQPFHYAWLLILIRFVGWKEPKQGIFLSTNLNYRGAQCANLWFSSDAVRQEANNIVFYYYYNQLCKAINSSPHITREVIDAYGKVMCFVIDRHHIYLQPHAQQGGDRHIGYYRMSQEDIEQVIKDQPEVWVENLDKEKEKGKGKGKEQEEETQKEKDKGKGKENKPKTK